MKKNGGKMKDICGCKAREIKKKVGERKEKGMSRESRKKMEGRKEIKRKERKKAMWERRKMKENKNHASTMVCGVKRA